MGEIHNTNPIIITTIEGIQLPFRLHRRLMTFADEAEGLEVAAAGVRVVSEVEGDLEAADDSVAVVVLGEEEGIRT